MENNSPTSNLPPYAANLVDDALAKVNELGTVGAMKWLAREMHTYCEDVAQDAERYNWLRAGHMEFGVQPDSDPNSDGHWYWVHSGDLKPAEVDTRIDKSLKRFPVKTGEAG